MSWKYLSDGFRFSLKGLDLRKIIESRFHVSPSCHVET